MTALLSGLAPDTDFARGFITLSRYALPALALWILLRCVLSMFRCRYEPEIWGYLKQSDGTKHPLLHWENLIGRSRSADICLSDPALSRTHAALIRSDKGVWTVLELRGSGSLTVNGEPVTRSEIRDGDKLTLAGRSLRFIALTDKERSSLSDVRTSPDAIRRPGFSFLLLTVFQCILAAAQLLHAEPEHRPYIVLSYLAVSLLMWFYYLVMRSIRRSGFEVEIIAFFLSTLGLMVAADSVPTQMFKHILLLIAGVALFLLLGWWLRDLRRTRALRWVCGFAAIGFLALNLLTAQEVFGAKNWLYIAGFSVQPSEFVKIAYIYAGAATLDRLYAGRNLFLFIGFSALCVGALALMGDFGTALVFFACFLVISFLRSGNIATVFLAIAGAVLACFLALYAKPHIAARFSAWGHIWESPYGFGFQQTHALSAAASGGLFGMGAGAGWLTGIVAADTDLVFCVLCEELGLCMGILAVLAVVLLSVFAMRDAAASRSSFYVIAACASVSVMMMQLALNVLGSVDVLPFTGVTFPFVSRGGSSLISCWTLLAFIKASDTRQNASFAQKLPSRGSGSGEEAAE